MENGNHIKRDLIQQSIHIERGMKNELEVVARIDDRSVANMIRILLREALDARKA